MCCKIKATRPFLTYKEQLERIKNHYKLDIVDEKLCLGLLKTISYYDLINGYKDCFMENEEYKNDIDLIKIFKFYLFDKDFQSILFKYSVYVENFFKTKLSYVISESFGVIETEYLNPKQYSANKKKYSVIKKIEKIIERKGDDSLEHYKENHSHVPPWILLKSTTFSNSIELYLALKRAEKTKVLKDYILEDHLSSDYEKTAELFRNMIIIVRKFRNKIAHNYKVIGKKITGAQLNMGNSIKFLKYNLYTEDDIKNNDLKTKKDCFSMIVSLINLLDGGYLSNLLVDELLFALNKAKELEILNEYIKYNLFPIDIIDRLENLKQNKI